MYRSQFAIAVDYTLADRVEGRLSGNFEYLVLRVQQDRINNDAAKERIFSLLPEDQKKEMIALFDEFEAFETAESKFAHAMDNFRHLHKRSSACGHRGR